MSAQPQIWVCSVQTAFIVRGEANMKTRELSLGETSICEQVAVVLCVLEASQGESLKSWVGSI